LSPARHARSSASAPSKPKIEPSSEIEPDRGELVEVGADMSFEHLLHHGAHCDVPIHAPASVGRHPVPSKPKAR
jgi:hypothetical protein